MNRLALASLLLVPRLAIAQAPSAQGRDLFTGERPLSGGGPPCAACHALAGEGLAATANLGPALSSLAGVDPGAIEGLLEDLPFPTMTPLYAGRPLAPEERTALAAFLAAAAARGAPEPTHRVELLGAAGAGLLLGVIGLAGRRRTGSSRAKILAGANTIRGGQR
ncbi:MAG: hypothetical protein QM704_10545 [Anaeromyxobacteraceae bacterium]